MNITALSRTGFAVALSAIMASWVAPVQAAEPTGSPLFPSLSLTPAIKDRMFMRLSYVYSNTKTTSSDARGIDGNVVNIADLRVLADAQPAGTKRNQYRQAVTALEGAVPFDQPDNPTGLGAPSGIKARAGNAGTPAFSLGYYFSDEYDWVVEALLLGLPLNISVYGDGVNGVGNPNGVNGKKIITTKMLPPTVLFGRYFGAKDAMFRPYLGLGAMYAIFFDTKATQVLNEYQGGSSPGDTTVSNKNAFGVGPFVGFQAHFGDGWQAGFNVGMVRLKTEATLITRNTVIKSSTGVTRDYAANIDAAIQVGNNFDANTGLYPAGFTTQLMADLLASQGKSSFGTFRYKQNNTFDNTIMMFSVGRSF